VNGRIETGSELKYYVGRAAVANGAAVPAWLLIRTTGSRPAGADLTIPPMELRSADFTATAPCMITRFRIGASG
jgi:hypothetical protein